MAVLLGRSRAAPRAGLQVGQRSLYAGDVWPCGKYARRHSLYTRGRLIAEQVGFINRVSFIIRGEKLALISGADPTTSVAAKAQSRRASDNWTRRIEGAEGEELDRLAGGSGVTRMCLHRSKQSAQQTTTHKTPHFTSHPIVSLPLT
jgi:hypothetical protein